MSKIVGPARWKCDRCSCDGGEVDADETYPHQWIALSIRVGTPQIDAEQRIVNTLHFCHECAETLLFHTLTQESETLTRLKLLFKRPSSPPSVARIAP